MTRIHQILLAEDDMAHQDLIRAFFADSPQVHLTVVSDGRAALEIASSRKFDLLIVEQNIPYISGDRVVRHLRASNSPNAGTPVIRLNGAAPVLPQGTCPATDTFVPKPVVPADFLSAVGFLINAS